MKLAFRRALLISALFPLSFPEPVLRLLRGSKPFQDVVGRSQLCLRPWKLPGKNQAPKQKAGGVGEQPGEGPQALRVPRPHSDSLTLGSLCEAERCCLQHQPTRCKLGGCEYLALAAEVNESG